MEIPLLRDIIIICGLALGVGFFCQRFTIPDTVGFLLTGILAGPNCLGLVIHVSEVEQLAEIGVVCLLFTIGLEFSFKSLLKIKTSVLFGGTIQVGLSIVGASLLATVIGLPPKQSIFFGFLLSLSSTAIVLKIMQQRAETESPHGRLILGILIFQDIIVVAMMLAAPFIAGKGSSVGLAIVDLALKATAITLVVLISVKWVAPRFIFLVAGLRSQQLFLLGIVMVALGATWLTSTLGLSLALGAFIAGLIVSESEFSERALGNILPFKDLFTSFFFVSIGMLLDLKFVFGNIVTLSTATVIVISLKFFAAGTAAITIGLPLRTAILTGIALCQVGEFSFVLSETGFGLGLIDPRTYQFFLGLSVLTMILTPFLIESGNRVVRFALSLPVPSILRRGFSRVREHQGIPKMNDHLIIVGFGIGGRNLSQVAASAGIPKVIIELNPETVRNERSKNVPIFYGDATTAPVLRHTGVTRARALVIMISDPGATRRIIDVARRLNPSLYIITRTRFISEIEVLSNLGANEVVTEEYEASIEILVRVLRKYLTPRDDIDKFVAQIRAHHYRMFRSSFHESTTISDLTLDFSETEISSVRVLPTSSAVGKSIKDLQIRKKFGVTVLALKRGVNLITNPSADEKMMADDVTVVLGGPEGISNLSVLLNAPEKMSIYETKSS